MSGAIYGLGMWYNAPIYLAIAQGMQCFTMLIAIGVARSVYLDTVDGLQQVVVAHDIQLRRLVGEQEEQQIAQNAEFVDGNGNPQQGEPDVEIVIEGRARL